MGRPAGSRVSLCMIVRDEEANLPACLTPVAHLFDELIVVDTGSSDHTSRVAAALGCQVYEYCWNDDFSAARNAALTHATGDWIFWLDADDRIDAENCRRLAQLFDSLRDEPKAYNVSCVMLPEHAWDRLEVVTHTRLFRRHPQIAWRRRVHEDVLSSILEQIHEPVWVDIEIQHIGYRDPRVRRRKLQRNLSLLRRDYAVDPHNLATLFYLGLTYAATGNHSQALTYLLQCRQHAMSASPMIGKMYALLATTLTALGRLDEALMTTGEGLRNFPDDPELLLLRATLHGMHGDISAVERCLLRVIQHPTSAAKYLWGVDRRVRLQALYTLGLSYLDSRRLNQSQRIFWELVEQYPDDADGWVGLGQLYLLLRRCADVALTANRLRLCPGGDALADTLLAELHSNLGQHAEARRFVDAAISKSPQMVWARIALAEILLRAEAPADQQAAAWQEVLQVSPGNSLAEGHLKTIFQPSQSQPAPCNPVPWTSVSIVAAV